MACQSLGFSQSASTEFQASNSSNFMSLKDDATLNATIAEGHRLYSMLKSTKEACAEGAVEIQCQEFSKFGCELKMCYLIPPLIQFFIFYLFHSSMWHAQPFRREYSWASGWW